MYQLKTKYDMFFFEDESQFIELSLELTLGNVRFLNLSKFKITENDYIINVYDIEYLKYNG